MWPRGVAQASGCNLTSVDFHVKWKHILTGKCKKENKHHCKRKGIVFHQKWSGVLVTRKFSTLEKVKGILTIGEWPSCFSYFHFPSLDKEADSCLHLSLCVAGNEHNKIWCKTLWKGNVILFHTNFFPVHVHSCRLFMYAHTRISHMCSHSLKTLVLSVPREAGIRDAEPWPLTTSQLFLFWQWQTPLWLILSYSLGIEKLL